MPHLTSFGYSDMFRPEAAASAETLVCANPARSYHPSTHGFDYQRYNPSIHQPNTLISLPEPKNATKIFDAVSTASNSLLNDATSEEIYIDLEDTSDTTSSSGLSSSNTISRCAQSSQVFDDESAQDIHRPTLISVYHRETHTTTRILIRPNTRINSSYATDSVHYHGTWDLSRRRTLLRRGKGSRFLPAVNRRISRIVKAVLRSCCIDHFAEDVAFREYHWTLQENGGGRTEVSVTQETRSRVERRV